MKHRFAALLLAVTFLLASCSAPNKITSEPVTVPAEPPMAEPAEPLTEPTELPTIEPAAGTLRCDCLDAGKADCLVLQTEKHLVIIDTGVTKTGKDLTEFVESLGVERVDALILTHFDKDHIGGAKHLLKKVEVAQVILPDYSKDSSTMDKLMDAMDDHELTPTYATQELSFSYDGVDFIVYPTARVYQGEDESNEFSLAVYAKVGEKSLLFTGDAVGARLDEVISQLPEPKTVDFVKIPHHGGYDDRTDSFLQTIAPKFAVITCSESDPPDTRVLEYLRQLGTDTYLTSDGSVTVSCDGKSITLTQH